MPAMIIGLLEAETLPPHIADRFGSYGDMFVHLLQPFHSDLDFRYYAADQDQLPGGVDECDAYILTGSRHNAYDRDPWIESLKNFVRLLDERQKKLLGICFGHQLIAEALGGKARKSHKGWGSGSAHFEVSERPRWMQTQVSDFDILVSHQDQVEELPPRAGRFARSDFCRNGGYFLDQHIFCLQGHPEFSKGYALFLINKREKIIGEATAERARDSLKTTIDTGLFQSWLRDFFVPESSSSAV